MSVGLGTPDGTEEAVGAALARMRRARGMTGAELASAVGMSQPKISRIERGRGLVDPEDVARIAEFLGASDAEVTKLTARAERSHDRMTDWRVSASGLAGRYQTMAEWEKSARHVRVFEPAVIPGLLQTSGYARAVFQALQRALPKNADGTGEPALLAAVSALIRQQEVLADVAKSFSFVLAEAVLSNSSFPPVEMLAQLHHLRDVATRPNVNVRVVPGDAPAGVPLIHGFTLIDDSLLVVELFNTALVSRSRRDAETYRHVFKLVEERAVDIGPLLDNHTSRYLDRLREPSPGR